MSAEIHVGDVGTVFEPTVMDENGDVVNLSTASTRTLTFRKPNGSVVTKTAALSTDGSDGKMRYVTIAGDLDVAGRWSVQGHVVFASGDWHTDTYVFRVHPNLS